MPPRMKEAVEGSRRRVPKAQKESAPKTAAKAKDEKAAKPRLTSSERLAKSFGGQTVRLTHNPSKSDTVTKAKTNVAKLLNDVHKAMTNAETPEQKRLFAVVRTKYEEAVMWHVKALTQEVE